jgi:hypothetical protein
MSNQYLESVLAGQDLLPQELATLQGLRAEVERLITPLGGNPRFYYAGSYGKDTIIRDRYDLDVVIYWPSTITDTLKALFDITGSVLRKRWNVVNPKTVAWEVPFDGGFHIDAVPGRALDASYRYANLHRRDTGTSLQTSIKTHIDHVRNSGRRNVIRLLKLWRNRNNVPLKTFILELVTVDACKGYPTNDLGPQLMAVFQYIENNIVTAKVIDPANTNNVISDDLTLQEKYQIQAAARTARGAQYWNQVFRFP